jgi:hypothetical protein
MLAHFMLPYEGRGCWVADLNLNNPLRVDACIDIIPGLTYRAGLPVT